ncbi:oligosaccharide flippase family protein [Vibrio astriarenae]
MLSKSSIASNALWHTLSQVFSRGVRFLTIPIIVRLLDPEQLGDVAITMALTMFVATVFGNGGTIDTMVYYCKRLQHVFKSLLWFTIGVSALLSASVFVLSQPISLWINVPSAKVYLEVMSLFLPVVMLQSVFQAKLIEQQAFAYIAKCQASISTIATLIAIALAFNGLGGWSLLIQHIFTTSALCGLFYRRVTIAEDEQFRSQTLKQILPYYYKSTLYNTIIWLGSESPLLIASKTVGSAGAGIYSAMSRAACMPMEILGRAFQLSFFSELSAKRADEQVKQHQQQQLFWSIKCRFLALTTLYTLGALVAYPVVRLVLGEQYTIHSDAFFWLCIGFAVISSAGEIVGFLQGTGRINLVTILSTVRCVLVMSCCYLMWSFSASIEAVAQGFALANTALLMVYLITIFLVLKFSFKAYISHTLPLITVLFSAIGTTYLVDTLVPKFNPFVDILVLSTAYLLSLSIAFILLLPNETGSIRRLLTTKVLNKLQKQTLREHG